MRAASSISLASTASAVCRGVNRRRSPVVEQADQVDERIGEGPSPPRHHSRAASISPENPSSSIGAPSRSSTAAGSRGPRRRRSRVPDNPVGRRPADRARHEGRRSGRVWRRSRSVAVGQGRCPRMTVHPLARVRARCSLGSAGGAGPLRLLIQEGLGVVERQVRDDDADRSGRAHQADGPPGRGGRPTGLAAAFSSTGRARGDGGGAATVAPLRTRALRARTPS